MVNLKREGFGLLRNILKFGRELIKSDEDIEPSEEPIALPIKTENIETKPMTAYWENDQEELLKNNEPFKDVFLKKLGLDRIPDTTDNPVAESHYDYERLSLVYMPELIQRIDASTSTPHSFGAILPGADVTEGAPKPGAGIPNGRDAGVVAGIVAAVISGVIILGTLIAVFMYRHYVHRNVTSMNFDNPVYRKTTEDQFALEKNGYAPGSKLYPSTVGEEAQEPLNTPGTNDFV